MNIFQNKTSSGILKKASIKLKSKISFLMKMQIKCNLKQCLLIALAGFSTNHFCNILLEN